ncbi:hypothetical protein H2199_007428 [Coniosporium tulheliwenetii]|uniref:Uncharacterized protein n=1 Tax=Coniosporium tulheliwenetii TaxID=3383036 RepID=A0ACC2YPG5_9PEZI|nr:hypothetical protein H2199_007428 [Cladosporium sp. JES 115]
MKSIAGETDAMISLGGRIATPEYRDTDVLRRLQASMLEGQEMNAPRDEVESRPRTDAASPPDIRMSEASSAPKEEFKSGHQTEAASPLSDRMPEEADESEHEPDVILIEPGVMFIDPVSFALAKLTDQLNEEVMKDIMETIAQPAIANVLERRSKDLNGTAAKVPCRDNEARVAFYDSLMQDIREKANNGDPCAQIITDLYPLFKAKSEQYFPSIPDYDWRLHSQYEHQSAIRVAGDFSVTLASILSLQPGTTEQAWLDESLIDMLISLYEPDRTNTDAYFC